MVPPRQAMRRVSLLMVAALPASGALADERAGTALFKQHCSACHQSDGGGIPGVAPPLAGPHWQKLLQERNYLPRVVAFGLAGQIRIGDSTYNSAMPAQPQLADDQLALVINFVAAELNAAVLPPGWRRYETADIAVVRATPHGSNEQRQLRKQILAQ